MAKTTILVVEDERIIAEDIQFSLEGLGFQVIGVVASGEEALESAGKNRPDLVIMDIVLQGAMDGMETTRRLQTEYGIPVVFLTAHTNVDMIKKSGDNKLTGCVIKPFQENELKAAIEKVLGKKG